MKTSNHGKSIIVVVILMSTVISLLLIDQSSNNSSLILENYDTSNGNHDVEFGSNLFFRVTPRKEGQKENLVQICQRLQKELKEVTGTEQFKIIQEKAKALKDKKKLKNQEGE